MRKWLTAGTSEEVNGEQRRKAPSHRGAVISPLLANIYSHYVFDLWAQCGGRRRYATGNVMVRYADDIVIRFDKRYDARRFRSHAAQTEGSSDSRFTRRNRLMEFRPSLPKTRAIREKANQKSNPGSRIAKRSQRQVHADTKDPPGSDDGNSEAIKDGLVKALALLIPNRENGSERGFEGYLLSSVPGNFPPCRSSGHASNLWRRALRRRAEGCAATKQTNWQPHGCQGFGFFIHGLWSGSPRHLRQEPGA
nr:reverse transcriptase domain-containing protein [Klebsiella pneumoniae]